MKTKFTFLHFLIVCFLMSCTQESSKSKPRITKEEQIINRAIEWAGGMDKWNSLKTINYKKRSRLLLENGDVEYDINQNHDYVMSPSLFMDIQWETDAGKNQIQHSDSASLKYVNDSLVDQGNKVRESAFSSLYVLGMPFKLKDPGIYVYYEGQQTFRDKTADILKVTYSPEEHKNHSTADLWWYYFDAVDGAFLGAKVYHAPTYALIENLAFNDVEGLKLQKRRMSYRCDSLGNKQFLRAEFWYDDFEVKFD